jgi:hypothetical protein
MFGNFVEPVSIVKRRPLVDSHIIHTLCCGCMNIHSRSQLFQASTLSRDVFAWRERPTSAASSQPEQDL